MQLITCPNCRAQFFASNKRAPICGKCSSPVSLDVKNVSRALEVNSKPGFFARLRTTPFAKKGARPVSYSPEYTNNKAKADLLAKKAWGSRQDIAGTVLNLHPKTYGNALAKADVVSAMLRHVGRVAANLSVPMKVPRLVTERMVKAAGQFVEEDGWVKIAISPDFFRDDAAGNAILCHEMCHYVLFANGIRQSPTLENERLTDTAMFVFGLGEIFLSGYQRSPREYRTGHRLGYLTDGEYRFLRQYVPHLRSSEEFLRSAQRNDDWRWDRSLR